MVLVNSACFQLLPEVFCVFVAVKMLRILDLVEVKKVLAIILTNLVLEGDVDCDLKEIS